MKPLIAVVTCWVNENAAIAIRRTWAGESPIPVKFFLGESNYQTREPWNDEVVLAASDGYKDLVAKVKLVFQWARSNGFTDVLKCDDDCYVAPERLKDVIGKYNHIGMRAISPRHPAPFLVGGAGYVVGARALDFLCTAPIPTGELSEDGWVSDSLAGARFKSAHDPRFTCTRRTFGDPMPVVPRPDNNVITGGELHTLGEQSELYRVHRRFQNQED